MLLFFFFVKQKTAYEMRISDWSSDVCSSDLHAVREARAATRNLGTGVTRRSDTETYCAGEGRRSLQQATSGYSIEGIRVHARSEPAPERAFKRASGCSPRLRLRFSGSLIESIPITTGNRGPSLEPHRP